MAKPAASDLPTKLQRAVERVNSLAKQAADEGHFVNLEVTKPLRTHHEGRGAKADVPKGRYQLLIFQVEKLTGKTKRMAFTLAQTDILASNSCEIEPGKAKKGYIQL